MQQLEEKELMTKSRANDEIDLSVLFNFIRNFFERINGGIAFTVRAVKLNKLLLILFVALGGGLGFLAFKVTKPYFTSTMTLVLADIRNEFVEDQLLKLSAMIKDDNFIEVANALDVSAEAANEIKSMKFINLDEARISEDSILMGSPFRIELSLYDNKLFNSMEPAITNYLENNRYFSKQKRIKQRQVEGVIAKLKNEISSIDSLKTTVSSPRGPVGGFVYGEPLDPTNLYRESIGMYKEQAKLEAELEQLDNIQVVTGFSPRANPTGPNMIKYVGFGMLIFSFFGLIFVYRKEKARM
ncbi:chain length determinant protein [Pontibacter locisalis]|uniref:Chain length determinant protein n=1 Tax=Pontibacter locisalis TaxID=1719035 RepID=A0ABW5IG79_9BACT